MTTQVADPTTLDVSGTKKIPLTRLTRVELRKMADTRAGMWLLVAVGILTAGIIAIVFLTAPVEERTFTNFVGVTATPQGFLLPILGILLVTSEWNQRTALVTFTLTPHRGRVLLAKTLAALALGMAAIVVATLVAVLATVVGGAADPWAGFGATGIGKFVLLQVCTILQGLAFGLVFLSSSVAIVSFFVLPSVLMIVSSVWDGIDKVLPWIDLGTAQMPLFMSDNVSNEQWAQLATSSLLWVVLPFAFGVLRVLRSEIK